MSESVPASAVPEPVLPAFTHFAGIDWAAYRHQVCLLVPGTPKPLSCSIEQSPAGFALLLRWLRSHCGDDLSVLAVSIESPVHPIVDALLEASVHVFAINPKQLDRFRDRRSLAGAKDDTRDALVLAVSLRTDRDAFRLVAPPGPECAAIREALRGSLALEEDLRRHANRLYEHLLRYAPSLLQLCPGADEPFFWDLLDVGLDPIRAAKLRLPQLQAILRRHRRRILTHTAARDALRAPRLTLRPGIVADLLLNVADLTAILRVTHSAHARAQRRLRDLIAAAGLDAQIIDSLPGAGEFVTAAFLAEAAEPLQRHDLAALRTRCGTAPVTKRSGKQHTVSFRRASNPILRNACWVMARTAVVHDPWALALYVAMRQRGLSYNRALRGVADRLLKRLVALLRNGSLYDPNYRQSVPRTATLA